MEWPFLTPYPYLKERNNLRLLRRGGSSIQFSFRSCVFLLTLLAQDRELAFVRKHFSTHFVGKVLRPSRWDFFTLETVTEGVPHFRFSLANISRFPSALTRGKTTAGPSRSSRLRHPSRIGWVPDPRISDFSCDFRRSAYLSLLSCVGFLKLGFSYLSLSNFSKCVLLPQ